MQLNDHVDTVIDITKIISVVDRSDESKACYTLGEYPDLLINYDGGVIKDYVYHTVKDMKADKQAISDYIDRKEKGE